MQASRIELDWNRLLGFNHATKDASSIAHAAKVGNKPSVGISIASACHDKPTDTPDATGGIGLTYPAGTDR